MCGLVQTRCSSEAPVSAIDQGPETREPPSCAQVVTTYTIATGVIQAMVPPPAVQRKQLSFRLIKRFNSEKY